MILEEIVELLNARFLKFLVGTVKASELAQHSLNLSADRLM